MGIAISAPRTLSVLGWARIFVRLAAMLLWLLACLPLFLLWRLLRLRNPWARAFLAGIGAIAGVRTRVHGHRVKRGAFLLANHVSWIDITAVAGATGTAFVGHDGLAGMPLLKWLCSLNDTVYVARHDRASVHQQIDAVRQAISDTGALTIFPEGTTSDGTGLLPFKSSLLSAIEPVPAGVAVQPLLLDYGSEADRIAWVGEEHGLDNFLKILARRRPVRLDLYFLPALTGEALTNRKTMAAAARDAIARQLAA
jgi:lyso-ornithine lipid O-acyltransferase